MAEQRFVSLRHDPDMIVLGGSFEIEDEFLHAFFKEVKATEYDELFIKALKLGAYALKEQEIGQFLGYVENQLDIRLHELKLLYQTRTLKERGAAKGVAAEADIGSILQDFVDGSKWSDEIVRTGETIGVLPRRKVGDLVATIEGTTAKIVIESKWDKATTLGDPTSGTSNPEKTAYGQNLTALINREAEISIFVTDRSLAHATITGAVDGLLFQPEIPGLIAIVDRNADDWSNLKVAYGIARALALHSEQPIDRNDRTMLIIKRLVRDVNLIMKAERELDKIADSSRKIGESVEVIKELMEQAITSAKRSEELLNRVIAREAIPELEWKSYFDES